MAKLSKQDKIEFVSLRRFSLVKFWRYNIIKSISAANTFVDSAIITVNKKHKIFSLVFFSILIIIFKQSLNFFRSVSLFKACNEVFMSQQFSSI